MPIVKVPGTTKALQDFAEAPTRPAIEAYVPCPSPADSVDSNGRIEESCDGGQTWKPASNGLKAPWRRHMVERFAQTGDELLAVLSNGELIAAPLTTLEWRRILLNTTDVNGVTMMSIGEMTSME